MSDIDMQSYAGEVMHPAAVEAPVSDSNSYQQETMDVSPVQPGLMEQPAQPELPAPAHQLTAQEHNFKALRDEVDRMKSERELERREYQLQIDMLRANQMQRHEPTPQPKERPMFDGMKDDDIPNVSELRREMHQREQAYQARIEELEVQSTRPDYAEVIEKFALPLVKEKPHLAEGIQGARNKALFAYELGKMAQQMKSVQQPVGQMQQPARTEQYAQRIVENSRKPGTLSSAGGQGALSKADYFASMSDSEFMKFANTNLEGI